VPYGVDTWIGGGALARVPRAPAERTPGPALRLSPPLLAWLRPLAGLPVDPAASCHGTGPGRPGWLDRRARDLLGEARTRGLVPPDGFPRLSPEVAAIVRSVAEPSLVVSAAHSAFGTVLQLQIRAGDVPVLVRPAADGLLEYEPQVGLDVATHLLARLDLLGRDEEPAPAERWEGTLAEDTYFALRRTDPGNAAAVDELTVAAGCPADLVRAAATPISMSRVEVVRREGAGTPAGPTAVLNDELAWIDGGVFGLWTVHTGEPGRDRPAGVSVRRSSAAEVAARLTRAVWAQEGC
jgi:hypothetical protein